MKGGYSGAVIVVAYEARGQRYHYRCGVQWLGPPMWSGCRPKGPGFDSRRDQIFLVAVGLERGSLSLVRINEELLERKSSGCDLEN
jgi:hypothetical protein